MSLLLVTGYLFQSSGVELASLARQKVANWVNPMVYAAPKCGLSEPAENPLLGRNNFFPELLLQSIRRRNAVPVLANNLF
jgi:hypothetical protein